MKAAWAAAVLVVACNIVAIGPAVRERAAPVGQVTVQVCGAHVVGGWRDGELPMLSLPLDMPTEGWGDVIPQPTLLALGFDAADLEAVGDSLWSGGAWPAPRRAWLTLRQRSDSGLRYTIATASAERPEAAPGELVVQGLVAIDRIWQELPVTGDSVPPPRRRSAVGVTILRLLPPQLGLDRAQAAKLRPLRRNDRWDCVETLPVTLAFGARGGVWVEAVGTAR